MKRTGVLVGNFGKKKQKGTKIPFVGVALTPRGRTTSTDVENDVISFLLLFSVFS